MYRVRSRNAYQNVSSFDKGRQSRSNDSQQNMDLRGSGCTDSQLRDHGCGYLWHCITDRIAFNNVINEELGYTNGETSFSQMNPGYVCSIKMVASLFWQHHELPLSACIRLRHTDPTPVVMVWVVIGYTSRSPLGHIDGTLNSARYISGVLRPKALPFIRALRNPTFQQDNARVRVHGFVRTFLDTENVRLLPWLLFHVHQIRSQ
ncbi:transposable element Tcb1 transposase [Trichonephila clavipes]|nr:transposable element Tcb1 transposase [Trichonephila clavipes]